MYAPNLHCHRLSITPTRNSPGKRVESSRVADSLTHQPIGRLPDWLTEPTESQLAIAALAQTARSRQANVAWLSRLLLLLLRVASCVFAVCVSQSVPSPSPSQSHNQRSVRATASAATLFCATCIIGFAFCYFWCFLFCLLIDSPQVP